MIESNPTHNIKVGHIRCSFYSYGSCDAVVLNEKPPLRRGVGHCASFTSHSVVGNSGGQSFVVTHGQRHQVQVDLAAIGVAVVAHQQFRLDQVRHFVVDHVVLSIVLAPDQLDVTGIALDDASLGVQHGAGGAQGLFDETVLCRVLVIVAQQREHCDAGIDAVHAVDAQHRFGNCLWHAVDNHRAGLVADALAGRRRLCHVDDPDSRIFVAGAIGADRETFGRGQHRSAGFGAEDQLHCCADGVHGVLGGGCGMVHSLPFKVRWLTLKGILERNILYHVYYVLSNKMGYLPGNSLIM